MTQNTQMYWNQRGQTVHSKDWKKKNKEESQMGPERHEGVTGEQGRESSKLGAERQNKLKIGVTGATEEQ